MKKIFILLFVGIFLISSGVFPQKPTDTNPANKLGSPIRAYLNLNNISTIFKTDGISDVNIYQNGSGFKYPKETGNTAVYCSGLLWGAKIAGDPQVRVGGSSYWGGLQGGKILSPGLAEDPNDPHVRIYRVRPDVYPGGPPVDLSWEALDEGKTEPEVRAQYEFDWTEWRWQDGAPYFDGNNNGQYDPDPASGDVPGIVGAIQTIWFVANDLDPGLTYSLYGTAPIGIEYQATIWEYKDSLGFDNFFFRKYKLINKSFDTFDSMYISMWSDPDIGYGGNDFVGCDTLLSLGYAYNAVDVDSGYLPLPPPAVGFDLIRGPLIPGNPGEDRNRNGVEDIYDFGLNEENQQVNGFINLPMTAFYYFINGDSILTDPVQGSYLEGAVRFYRFMQGKIGLTGEYFINPHTGLPTTFWLSGNPVDSTGWIDGQVHGPGDRRLGLSTGPFQMEPGDTQIVVIAEIAAGAIYGVTRKMAIDTLKYYSALAQKFYDNAFTGTLHVPANYATIQEAIDAAIDGNIVLVEEGTYYENINFRGKAITVASHFLIDGNESHIENTIIDGSQPTHPDSGTVVLFKSGEDTTSVLCGFTITGGTGTLASSNLRAGGGIGFVNSGAQIKNNIIEFNTLDNTPWAYGGGIFTNWDNNVNIVIKNNIIRNNTCNGTDYACGGAIKITTTGYALISNNKIFENTVSAGIESTGGGIECWGPINEVYIVNNYIKGNTVQTNYNGGGGIDIYECTTNTPVLENNIIVGNYSNLYGGGVEVDLDLDERLKPGGIKTAYTTESDNLLTPVFFANNTIVNNTAGVSGGGIYTNDMTSDIMNSIIWGNTAPADSQIAGTVNVVYSDIEGGWTGEGNINSDPLFSDTLYHLSDSSPCMEEGIDSIDISGTMYYCPLFCYDGIPRPTPAGTMPDMGACENPNPVGVQYDLSQIPGEYSLAQNYPNPFNPTTTIVYGLIERTNVELKLFDVLGIEIEIIVNGEQDAGYYEVEFNASRLASGIYFYRLQAGNFVETKKMVLMK